jgi:hypothetical protein
MASRDTALVADALDGVLGVSIVQPDSTAGGAGVAAYSDKPDSAVDLDVASSLGE